MESLNVISRTFQALTWLICLTLSSIIVVPWCAVQSLIFTLLAKDENELREIPQNEKRTVLLTGGPLTKGNHFLKKHYKS